MTRARAARRLAAPRPASVAANGEGRPTSLDSTAVVAVREEWVVEDRWWTGRPLRRRYFELVLADGRDLAAFQDLVIGDWYVQRA